MSTAATAACCRASHSTARVSVECLESGAVVTVFAESHRGTHSTATSLPCTKYTPGPVKQVLRCQQSPRTDERNAEVQHTHACCRLNGSDIASLFHSTLERASVDGHTFPGKRVLVGCLNDVAFCVTATRIKVSGCDPCQRLVPRVWRFRSPSAS